MSKHAENNPELNALIEDAKAKKTSTDRIGFVKESILHMIKQKQIEMFGTEPKTI